MTNTKFNTSPDAALSYPASGTSK